MNCQYHEEFLYVLVNSLKGRKNYLESKVICNTNSNRIDELNKLIEFIENIDGCLGNETYINRTIDIYIHGIDMDKDKD